MRAALAAAALALLAAGPLRAQDTSAVTPAVPVDSAATRPAEAARADSVPVLRPPVSPMGALWRSILLPGWGQAKMKRKLTGALFVTWEGVTLGMSIKTSHELRYLRATKSGSVGAKEKERQDWLVLLAFNHLFSAIEAYVSAHLWDFPQDLEIRAVPVPGGVGGAVRVPFRLP